MAEDNKRDLPDGVPASKQQLSNIDPDLISEFATQPGDPDPIPIKTFEERAEEEFARLDQIAAENPDATEIASQSTSSDVDGTVARVDTIGGAEQTPISSATSRNPVSYPDPDPEPAPASEPQITPSYTASPAARQTTISQLDATENALNSLEALPTQERLKVQTQIDALRDQRARLIAEARDENTEPEPVDVADDLDLFAEGSDVTVTEESTIVRDPEALERIETAIVGTAEPTFQDDVATGFGSFAEDEDAPGLDVAGGSVTSIPASVDDTQAQQQQIVPRTVETTAANEDIITEQEQQAQINQAALDRLRSQSAAQQQREPQGTGDWRVKLRLASGADYFYKATLNNDFETEGGPGILFPLAATDGIVFPYTPSIQILYAAEYNQYHPTHSNYQHYFYKGSKVGEVVMTATFTAQDTEEANYLLAVIHFLKSASKMFYGQDPERGSPPPLLFLTGLGDYQFNEAPCVISQFNYVLPNDVDYIRANVSQIRAGETNQTNLRNRNTGAALNSYSSRINRILTTPGLTIGAENPTSRISSKTANLSNNTATYVPTKMEMTITLLPVQNRLQVSEAFSLKQYANGSLIKGGFW